MPNIRISALPPATLPLDDPNTLFEVTVLEAGEEVSRKITLSEIAGATGLDASFLTLSANAQLPNERVLTEGTNISFVDTGPNGTLTINATSLTFPLLAPDGSAGAPSYSFSGDTDMGMFRLGGFLAFTVGGTAQWVIDGTALSGVVASAPLFRNLAASSTVPNITISSADINTGLGTAGADILSFIAGGVEIARATEVPSANQFAIAQSGASSVPELTSLADPDTGFRWPANNETVWIGGGSRSWNFSTAKFYSQFSNGPALLNEISSDTNPTVVADHADPDTGIGSSGNDELSIIAGGVEGIRVDETAGNVFITYFGPILVPFGSAGAASVGFDGDDDTGFFRPVEDAFAITAGGVESVRYAELSSQVIQTNSNQVGLTASVTQTQAGGLPLLSSYNEVATVATTGDALTAFAVVAGTRLTVSNNGANDLQLFPAVGDDFGAGVDTAITIIAGEIGIFIGRDATNWDTLFNNASGGTFTFPILAPDGTAGAPSYSYAGETDMGVFRLAEDFLGFSVNGITRIVVTTSGITGFIGNSGAIISAAATAQFPSVLAANGDTNTGMGWGGIDIVTLAAGGIEGVRYAEAASHIIQRNENQTGLTASVTQTQGGGLALLSSYNEIATVANSGDAVTAFSVAAGDRLVVINNGANDLQLFPASGDNIGGGVDTAISIAAGEIGIFIGRDAINWDTLYNAAAASGDVFKVGTPVDNQVGVWTGDGTIEGTTGLTYDGSDLDITGNITLTGTVDGIDIAVDVAANTLKITNATHTGQVTGATALALDVTAITAQPAAGILIGADTFIVNDGGALSEITATQMAAFFGNAIPGTVTDSMLRFDGSDYVEETQIQVTAAGVLSIRDASLADSISISHNGAAGTIASVGSTALNFTGVATQYSFDNNVVVAGDITVAGGNRLIVLDAVATDSVVIDHDGTDGNIVSTLTADLNFTGVSVGYKFDESIYITEKTTANADFAGLGQFWVRDDVPNIPMYTDDTGIDFKLGVANDAVQARRTTSYVLTTAFADVTLDTTDIETDGAIIEHSATTDNIEATVAGTYEFTYGADIDPSAAGNDNIQAFGRMRLNDAGVDIPGSLASQTAYEDASTIGNEVFGRLQCSFIVVLAASDIVTLQLMKIETGGTGIFTAEEVTVTAKRLL